MPYYQNSQTVWVDKNSLKRMVRGAAQVLFHAFLVAVSAGAAFSLPFVVSITGKYFWGYWSSIESEKIYLITLEIVTAVILLLVLNYLARSWRDRRIAKMAHAAGLIQSLRGNSVLAQRKTKKLKRNHGYFRDVMIISSTGARSFVDPRGDLHSVLHHCRSAKIMLLNPRSDGAAVRARSILDPSVTPESFREQTKKSVEFLRELRSSKNIRLKLYDETPLLKLAILGDFVWIKHYHPGLDAQSMPEYVFAHDQNPGSLYTLFYHYFLARWENPACTEYDLETHDLIHRDSSGKEIGREDAEFFHAPDANAHSLRKDLGRLSAHAPS